MYDIVIGRNKSDLDKFGTKGTIFLGKHYVKMGRTTSLANNILLDVSRSHVVFVCGKRGGGKCLHGDALITLSNGDIVPIKDLDRYDQEILTLNQELKIQKSEKTRFYKREVDNLLEIRLRTGKIIKLTPEHPLLTINGWVPAKDLGIGSRIATPRISPSFGEFDLEECRVKILAYLIAEGHLRNNFILFTNTDGIIVNDFRNAVREFDPNLKIRNHSSDVSYRIVENRKRVIIKQATRDKNGRFIDKPVTECRSSLRKWLDAISIYGKLAHQKYVPKEIFTLPKNKLSLFLNRLFSCDGSIYKEGSSYWKISYSSSSKQLIHQVQHLLLRFGVISYLRNKQTRKRLSYEIVIRGEFVNKYLQEIGFYGAKESRAKQAIRESPISRNTNVDTIPKQIWERYAPDNWAELGRKLNYSHPKSLRESTRYCPSRQKLLQIAVADEQHMLKKLAISDIFWDEILSVDQINKKETVYDITVPGFHNFIANDIIVHNSYTMGVIAEGMTSLPKEISENLAIIMLDTMGIYWTMKYPNMKDKEILDEWNLKPVGQNVKIFTPSGYYKEFKEKGIPTDAPFSVKPSELNPEDWAMTFGISRDDSVGVLIERVIHDLKQSGNEFSVEDIIDYISKDKRFSDSDKNSAINRFLNTLNWGIFDKNGTPLSELAVGGQVTVLDVSCYASMPGGWEIKSLVIGLVAQKLFIQRMVARKNEEYEDVHSAIHYFSDENKNKQEMPLVWLVIDEAHEFLPNQGMTLASQPLITILREGRQPGISLILASQQPGKIHTDVMTQSDTILSHRITAKLDTDALGMLMQSYMREGLDRYLNELPRVKGAAIILDDSNEKIFPMQVRPRFTWHGGEAPMAVKQEKKLLDV